MENDLTVRVSFERVRFLESLSESAMVVYLAIDRKDQSVVAVSNRLCTRVYINKQSGILPTPTMASLS
jgi:hypothetical protein